MKGVSYVVNTFLRNLKEWTIPQIDGTHFGPTGQAIPTGKLIPVRQMGITHATIVSTDREKPVIWYKNGPGGGEAPIPGARGNIPAPVMPMPGIRGRGRGRAAKAKVKPAEDAGADEGQPIPLTEFVIEFAWRERPPEKREAEDPAKKTTATTTGTPGTTAAPAGTAPTAAPGVPPAGNTVIPPPAGPQATVPGTPAATAPPAGTPSATPPAAPKAQ
jgi:hypothetical protein